jgi:nitroreductase
MYVPEMPSPLSYSASDAMVHASFSYLLFMASVTFSGWLNRRQENNIDDNLNDEAKNIDATSQGKNEALTLIQKRRSIFPKQYSTKKPVARYMIEDMLEAARWAPTHYLAQPWYFIVFETESSRRDLGYFLADHYKKTCEKKSREFMIKKYEKKLKNALDSAFVIAVCVRRDQQSKSPEVEDICSVAIAVQNMHLVATEYKLGAYWSSASLYEERERHVINPEALREFLKLPTQESFCIGWLYVGSFEGNLPQGRRAPMDSTKVLWR